MSPLLRSKPVVKFWGEQRLGVHKLTPWGAAGRGVVGSLSLGVLSLKHGRWPSGCKNDSGVGAHQRDFQARVLLVRQKMEL